MATYDLSWEYPVREVTVTMIPRANSDETLGARFRVNDVEYHIIPGPPPYYYPVGNQQTFTSTTKVKVELVGDYVFSDTGEKIKYLPKKQGNKYLSGFIISFIKSGDNWIADLYAVIYE